MVNDRLAGSRISKRRPWGHGRNPGLVMQQQSSSSLMGACICTPVQLPRTDEYPLPDVEPAMHRTPVLIGGLAPQVRLAYDASDDYRAVGDAVAYHTGTSSCDTHWPSFPARGMNIIIIMSSPMGRAPAKRFVSKHMSTRPPSAFCPNSSHVNTTACPPTASSPSYSFVCASRRLLQHGELEICDRP
jgi:hypothetical protein